MNRLAALLFALLLTGCGGGYVGFSVDSIPQGANVFVDGEFLGKTPTKKFAWHTREIHVPVTIELLNHKPMVFLVPAQVTFETEERALEKCIDYRFALETRRP